VLVAAGSGGGAPRQGSGSPSEDDRVRALLAALPRSAWLLVKQSRRPGSSGGFLCVTEGKLNSSSSSEGRSGIKLAFVRSKPLNLVIRGQGCCCREPVRTNAQGSGSGLGVIQIVCLGWKRVSACSACLRARQGEGNGPLVQPRRPLRAGLQTPPCFLPQARQEQRPWESLRTFGREPRKGDLVPWAGRSHAAPSRAPSSQRTRRKAGWMGPRSGREPWPELAPSSASPWAFSSADNGGRSRREGVEGVSPSQARMLALGFGTSAVRRLRAACASLRPGTW